ncbi:saccharopine dehydrogenase family protein [uncultured Martelella sp.]|uniref:saccharopine dehydrogenase family protein n=1 Tax=uncultured Martelella sp. TaxID=392331 RepID=UPI0037485465
MENGEILIVGGYGHVGSQIAARLQAAATAPVRIAGRDTDRLAAAATRLGCQSVQLDLGAPDTWPKALDKAGCVVVCVDQTDTGFAAAVLERGLVYLDITADDDFFRRIEHLEGLARAKGGRAVLSVGLAPGLTNLLVKAAAAELDTIERARIGILLGIGDAHGPAAIDWTLHNFKKTRPGTIEHLPFGDPPRQYPVLPFDFADQHVLRRTLKIADVQTFMTFDTPLLSRVMFAVLRRVAASAMLTRLFKALTPYARLGSDRTALSVEVHGTKAGQRIVRRMKMEGRKEARITALIAAMVVEHVLRHDIAPGVHHIEQILSIDMLTPHIPDDAGITFEI